MTVTHERQRRQEETKEALQGRPRRLAGRAVVVLHPPGGERRSCAPWHEYAIRSYMEKEAARFQAEDDGDGEG